MNRPLQALHAFGPMGSPIRSAAPAAQQGAARFVCARQLKMKQTGYQIFRIRTLSGMRIILGSRLLDRPFA
ncbi:MAG: hypothetical protein AB2693_08005 [Candidatus Thiodiazotropha sp.]